MSLAFRRGHGDIPTLPSRGRREAPAGAPSGARVTCPGMPSSASPKPKRLRLQPEERREQILDAARIAFSEQPYADVSLSDIARRAGVSRSLLNHYFDGKLELLIELMRQYAHEGPEVLRTDLGLPPDEMVVANSDAWLDFVEHNRTAALAYVGDGPMGQPRELRALNEQLREAMVDRIATNHFGGPDVPHTTRLALRAYTGLFAVACHDWLVTGEMTREQVSALLSSALLAIVRDVIPALEGASGAT